MADNSNVSNSASQDNPVIPVRTSETAGGKQLQHFRLDIGTTSAEQLPDDTHGVPVKIVSGAIASTVSLPTLTPLRVSFTSGASGEVLAANASRVAGAMVINNTSESFFLQIAAAAVLNQGIPLPPGGIWQVNTKQQVRAIYTNAATASLDVYEAT